MKHENGGLQDHPLNRLPGFNRFLQVAAGDGRWSDEELALKSSSPWWLLREAQAFIALARVHDAPEWISIRIKAAVKCVRELPELDMQSAAIELLQLDLPDELKMVLHHTWSTAFVQPSKPRWNGIYVLGTLAAACLIPFIILGAKNWLPQLLSPDSRVKQSSILASLTLSGHSKGDEATTVHSLDKYVFEAKSRTELPFGWLVAMDDEAAMMRQFSKNSGNEIVLTHHGQFDVRECHEFFAVILADNDFGPLHSEDVDWLSPEQIAGLQQLAENSSSAMAAEAIIERALRDSGFAGTLRLSVHHYKHLLTQRPKSITDE